MRRETSQKRTLSKAIFAALPVLLLVALQILGAEASAGEAGVEVLQAGLLGGSLFWRLMGVVGLCASVLILRRVAE